MNQDEKIRKIYGADPRYIPRYGFVQASNYLKVPANTLKNWVYGYSYPIKGQQGKKHSKALIVRPDKDSPLLSFINLTEAHVLLALRQNEKIRMDRVRRALDYLSKKFDSDHPLLDYEFQTNGIDLFIDHLGKLINVSRSGQYALKDIIQSFLHRIKRDRKNIPELLYPFPREFKHKLDSTNLENLPKPVSINPLVSFGKPVLVGSGVPTDIIFERFYEGDSIFDLADDYGIEEAQVEEAVRYETFAHKAA